MEVDNIAQTILSLKLKFYTAFSFHKANITKYKDFE